MSTELAPVNAQPRANVSLYESIDTFQAAQKMAESIAKSSMVPASYQNRPENVMIALEMANRTKTNFMAVMQNMYIIEGKPSWSSQFIIAVINSSGLFSPLRFEEGTDGKKEIKVWVDGRQETMTIEDKWCIAYAKDLQDNGKLLKGTKVSMSMAIADGWWGKKGSKWKSLPELMLKYRAAALFGRLYCPEMLMGMKSADEVEDIGTVAASSGSKASLDTLNETVTKTTSKPKATTGKSTAGAAAQKTEPQGHIEDAQVVNETPTGGGNDDGWFD